MVSKSNQRSLARGWPPHQIFRKRGALYVSEKDYARNVENRQIIAFRAVTCEMLLVGGKLGSVGFWHETRISAKNHRLLPRGLLGGRRGGQEPTRLRWGPAGRPERSRGLGVGAKSKALPRRHLGGSESPAGALPESHLAKASALGS